MNGDDHTKPATTKTKKKTWIIVAVSVGILVVAAVVIFALSRKEEDTSRVDQATIALEEASASLNSVDQLNSAADALANSNSQKAMNLSASSINDLEDTLTRVADTAETYPALEQAIRSALATGKEISRLAAVMAEGQAIAANANETSKSDLQSQAEATQNAADNEITVGSDLNDVLAELSSTISTASTDLEQEGAMSNESQTRINEAKKNLAKATGNKAAQATDKKVSSQFKDLASALEEQVSLRTTVNAPYDCGTDEGGTQVVINEGRTTCATALFVRENSTGPNQSTGPEGWDCSGSAKNLEGETLQSADGYSCSKGPVTLSFFSADATPAPTTTTIGDAPGFVSPSRNIICTIGSYPGNPVDVICQAQTKSWTPPPKPADCNLDWAGLLEVNYEEAKFVCGGSAVDPDTLPVLDYGTKIQRGAIECSSAEDGVTCKNLEQGFGFRIASGDFDLNP